MKVAIIGSRGLRVPIPEDAIRVTIFRTDKENGRRIVIENAPNE